MKYIYYLFLSLLLLTCKSSENFTGTIASRHSIDPFPSKEEWISILESIEKLTINEFEKDFKPSLLWQVGIYTDRGISLNFPGVDDETSNVYYSGADFNREFLEYFSKEELDVYLTIEPGASSVNKSISSVLNKYQGFECVKGICIDLEWIQKDEISNNDIHTWASMVKEFNEEYVLILKHWNITKVPEYYIDNLVYVNSIENIKDKTDFIKRATLWYKKFYPAKIGFLIGHKKDSFLWSNYSLLDVINELNETEITYNYIFWSETNLNILKK